MLLHYLIVFLVSMVPLIELRGAIPFSQGFGLPLIPSYIVSIIGNMLPVPFIYFFARKVLIWGADKPVIGKFFGWCLEKGERVVRSCRQRQEEDYSWHYCSLLESRCREPEPGQELWQPAS